MLRAKRRDAEARLDHPSNVSPDGTVALVQVRTIFPTTNVKRGETLLAALESVREGRRHAPERHDRSHRRDRRDRRAPCDLAGHLALLRASSPPLVALVLAMYFRSATLLILLVGMIGVGDRRYRSAPRCSPSGTSMRRPHFRSDHHRGNGINHGILLICTGERRGRDVDHIARLIVGTLRLTAVAFLLGAAIQVWLAFS